MQKVRIFEIPDCKMVSSGVGTFGDGVLERFDEWFSKLPRGIYPKDFLFWDCSCDEKQGFNWICLYEDGMSVPKMFSIIDFKGESGKEPNCWVAMDVNQPKFVEMIINMCKHYAEM